MILSLRTWDGQTTTKCSWRRRWPKTSDTMIKSKLLWWNLSLTDTKDQCICQRRNNWCYNVDSNRDMQQGLTSLVRTRNNVSVAVVLPTRHCLLMGKFCHYRHNGRCKMDGEVDHGGEVWWSVCGKSESGQVTSRLPVFQKMECFPIKYFFSWINLG